LVTTFIFALIFLEGEGYENKLLITTLITVYKLVRHVYIWVIWRKLSYTLHTFLLVFGVTFPTKIY